MPSRPLPTRDGVGPSCVALPPGPWPTLIDFLVQRFPAITRDTWVERIRDGSVVDEDGLAQTLQSPYAPRTRVFYYRSLDNEPRIPFEEHILFQDDHLLVVDKPHFLPVTPVGKYVQESLLVRLKRRLKLDDLAPLHRIDRETAGLVLFSVDPRTRGIYHALFSERRITKHYEAIVPALDHALPERRLSRIVPGDHFMCMKEVPGTPNSETRFEVLEQREDWTRLRLSPITGRRHQLRVHCAAMGLPIRNDAIYPVLQAEAEPDFDRPLQLLAAHIGFVDPLTQQTRDFASVRTLAPR
ncbi:MAG: pseudouridine synthase [Gammaproteobacteria bacterium]|nr:pseudouridine synthase [Gammaproteobacteria bacterium]MBU1442881.1 pseudouridine synthase [Gammaproteobacteria bacterium]MBU2286520.1 pseudouridine synthase [Gammaproteobacteria bacterium]MBU2408291.1 pseudouridine synthase [Gammaproteobacteria bacterium]